MSITQETGVLLFSLMFSNILLGAFVYFFFWPLITFLTPRALLLNYFKPPHFNSNEIELMRSFPLSLWRTMIFGWTLVFPSLDKKRKIKDSREIMPLWYKVFLYLLCIYTIIFFIMTTSIMSFLLIVPINR